MYNPRQLADLMIEHLGEHGGQMDKGELIVNMRTMYSVEVNDPLCDEAIDLLEDEGAITDMAGIITLTQREPTVDSGESFTPAYLNMVLRDLRSISGEQSQLAAVAHEKLGAFLAECGHLRSALTTPMIAVPVEIMDVVSFCNEHKPATV